MMQNEKNKTSDLRNIPGVGANMQQHLENIGIHCIADLRGKDPEELYRLDCAKKGFVMINTCMLISTERFQEMSWAEPVERKGLI